MAISQLLSSPLSFLKYVNWVDRFPFYDINWYKIYEELLKQTYNLVELKLNNRNEWWGLELTNWVIVG